MSPLRFLVDLGRSTRALLATWRGRFIALFLAVQLVLPLTYYLGRRNRYDERWAWRMFSPTRMVQCDPRMTIDDQPAQLGKVFHEAWIEIAKRGRFEVIEAMAARLCKTYPGKAVKLSLTCRQLDKSVESWGGYDLCRVPEI